MWRNPLHSSLPWSVVIQASAPGDAEFVNYLDNDPETRKFLGGPLGRTVEETRSGLLGAPQTLYIIRDTQGPIGYTAYVENKFTSEMDVLIILSAERRTKGVGSLVLRTMVGKWKSFFPKKPLSITTRWDNTDAQRLLERNGFNQVGEYHDPRHGQNFYIYKEAYAGGAAT